MTHSPLRLAVFDCDGTLVDSQDSIVQSMAAAFAAHGHPVPEAAAVRRVVGLPLLEAIARLLPAQEAGVHALVTEAYRDAFRALRQRDAVHEPLFGGIMEVLDVLDRQGWLLGVATGKAHQGLMSTLNTHGLDRRFVTLQTADRGPGKPHPGMMLQAMAETGVDPAQAVMIGDTTYDMEMARAAGAFAVGVAWGYHPADELLASGAHMVVDEVAALVDAVETVMEVGR